MYSKPSYFPTSKNEKVKMCQNKLTNINKNKLNITIYSVNDTEWYSTECITMKIMFQLEWVKKFRSRSTI